MPAPATQAEIRRYLKALREAGFEDGEVRVERGGTVVSIKVGKAAETAAADDWDEIVGRVEE